MWFQNSAVYYIVEPTKKKTTKKTKVFQVRNKKTYHAYVALFERQTHLIKVGWFLFMDCILNISINFQDDCVLCVHIETQRKKFVFTSAPPHPFNVRARVHALQCEFSQIMRKYLSVQIIECYKVSWIHSKVLEKSVRFFVCSSSHSTYINIVLDYVYKRTLMTCTRSSSLWTYKQ